MVCNNRRVRSHRLFKNQAARGKSSTGWLHGLKLLPVLNAFCEIIKLFLPWDVSDKNL
ncbi:transposase [Pedobacter suwonensis]|uniref:transposase n=1 Tax=Pedobacter suwonensis TaxID=332999 RepID=UPI000B84C401